jgi:hypothetical protein
MDKQAFADGYMAKSAGEAADTMAILGEQAKSGLKRGGAAVKEHLTNKRVPTEAYTDPSPIQRLAQSFHPTGNIGEVSAAYPGRVNATEATPEVSYGPAGGLAAAKAGIAARRGAADEEKGFHPALRAVKAKIQQRRAAAGK